MTEQDRDIICDNLIRDMCRGVDFGMSKKRIKVIAISADCSKALIKTPGHTGWSGIGSRSYYPGSVYLFPGRKVETIGGIIPRHREVFEVTRKTPLTKAKLIELMAEHLKPIGYTYEGMLELARP